jgi:hypothetical protein
MGTSTMGALGFLRDNSLLMEGVAGEVMPICVGITQGQLAHVVPAADPFITPTTDVNLSVRK